MTERSFAHSATREGTFCGRAVPARWVRGVGTTHGSGLCGTNALNRVCPSIQSQLCTLSGPRKHLIHTPQAVRRWTVHDAVHGTAPLCARSACTEACSPSQPSRPLPLTLSPLSWLAALHLSMVHGETPSLLSVDMQQHHVRIRASCGVCVLQRVVTYVDRAATAVQAIGASRGPSRSSRCVLTAVTVRQPWRLSGVTVEPVVAVFEW